MDASPFCGVPPIDSDDSCLSDRDSDDDSRATPSDDSSTDEDSDLNDDTAASTGAPTTRRQSAAASRRWEEVAWDGAQKQNFTKQFPVWQGTLPDADETREPVQYFRDFFDAGLLETIAQQSNLYCAQENPNCALRLDQSELEQFIGSVIYMSVVRLPRLRMYWATECRVPQVADVLSRDRFEEISKFLHFNDNNHMAASKDKLFKIRPVADSLLQKFQALPQDQMLFIGEQIVPFKGRSILKQYMPKKLHKWGYKIFVLCDTKGLVHAFHIYTGKTDPEPGDPDIGANGNIVLRLAKAVHSPVDHLLYFDHWFSSLDLFAALGNKGVPALGTMQENQLQGCRFSSDTDMKKQGRGTFEERRVAIDNVEIRAVKWFDSRAVIIASNFPGARSVSRVRRWDKNLKHNVFVTCPSIISLHHKFLGGFYALRELIASNRIQFRSKKYYHRFFFYFIDIVIVNSWLLYQRDCDSLDVPRKEQKDLLAFRTSIAQALCMQYEEISNIKREPPSSDVEIQKKKYRGPNKALPTLEVRSDAVGHWPLVVSERRRCKRSKCKGQSTYTCSKCNVHLCLNKNNNCFREFHK
ncbi:PREDICTED: piggyBac transposable element-derived protein 2-like [Cyprinodon variegatus]|uniref:piggyBac transposable element-derived protein 2-like n=1 Tax=Cyprinodon variegatus TaxID=28743 RepID=UPI0007426B22|nr:PREDICTED: piggyBac transposable element-derived protein 2-like [Cyprinodon variegatus]XP_015242425.1 PREDICTED: piggyBac transposable element-derived protein 2-like [Cyprinodon variegatus]